LTRVNKKGSEDGGKRSIIGSSNAIK
jgi:hypothetical protein